MNGNAVDSTLCLYDENGESSNEIRDAISAASRRQIRLAEATGRFPPDAGAVAYVEAHTPARS